MSGGGTTARGAFRFPYEFTAVVADIREKLSAIGMDHDFERIVDDFTSLMMDRDRALEDYTTAGYSSPTFTTVAGDGSGDFTTIRAAIQSQSAPTAQWSGYNRIIYVKPQSGGYLEGALGTVTFLSQTGYTIWTGPAGEDWGSGGGNQNMSYMTWQSGAWIKGSPNISIKGFNVVSQSSSGTILSSSSTQGGTLILNDCIITSPLIHSSASKNFSTITLIGCTGTLHGGAPGDSVQFNAINCSLQLGLISTGVFSANGGGTKFWGCGLSIGMGTTLTGAFDGSGTGFSGTLHDWRNNIFGPAFSSNSLTFSGSNIRFSNNVNGGNENSGFFNSTITFTDCGRGRNISQSPAYDYGTCSITENHMTGINLVINQRQDSSRLDSATMVSGTWGSVTLNGNNISALVAINTEFNTPPVLSISGNKNIVSATINKSNQASNGTPVLITGDNNVITFVQNGYTGSYTDYGSGNIINAATGTLLGMTIADAKGDLIAAFGNDDMRRLGVGSNDQVLTADSAQLLGLKWADPFQNRFDSKGDLLVGQTDNTPLRVEVGRDQRLIRADSTQAVGVSWDYQRTLNNRLTQNQASLETSTAGWAAESGCTIARSTAKFSHGAASLEVTKS